MSGAPVRLLDRAHADTVLRASTVSRFAISAPHPVVGLEIAALLSALMVAVFALGPAGMSLDRAAVAAFVGVLFPALFAAGATLNYFRQAGGTITVQRCTTIAAIDLTIIFAISLVGEPLSGAAGWMWPVLLSAAFAASVNMIVLAGTADPHLGRALAPSLVLPGGCAAAFLGMGLITPLQFYVGLLFVLVFAAGAALWVRIAIAPFARNFKEDGLELLHAILDAWAGWSAGGQGAAGAVGTLKMEAFFARHGRPKAVRFDALRLSKDGGRRLMWLVPELHPGPYADIGGSDLPAKAASALAGAAEDFAVFHGPSTHDDNPTGREQLAKVFAAVKEAAAGAEGSGKASKPVRVSSPHFTVTAQRIAGALVLGQSRAPLSSDDMDAQLGHQIRDACARAGFAQTVVLDGHNSVEADLGRIHAGSAEGRELVALCEEAAAEVGALKDGRLRVGWAVAALTDAERREYAIGKLGIIAAVTEAGGAKAAWVLIDGNNLKGGLRAEMLEALKGKVDLAEVFTTDNHAVNTTMGADNEVGSRRDNVPLVQFVVKAVEGALADLGEATAAAAHGEVPDVQVFGPGLTVRISATINAAVSVMIPAYVATMSAAVLACLAMVLALT